MKHQPAAVRQLSRRITHYNNMAGTFSCLTNERQMYVSHKFAVVVPNLRRAIAKALQGTRNACDDCKDLIPAKRLKAVPGAIRCLCCQERKERGAR